MHTNARRGFWLATWVCAGLSWSAAASGATDDRAAGARARGPASPGRDASVFGGFSADGSVFLVAKDRVCTPIAVDGRGVAQAAEPECKRVSDEKILRAHRFGKTKPTKEYLRSVHGTSVKLLGNKTTLLTWHGSQSVDDVRGVYVSPSGRVLAMEVVVVVDDGTNERAQGAPPKKTLVVVAFDMGNRLGRGAPVMARAASLYDRLMSQGGVWRQRVIPCERAEVLLTLKKSGEFLLDVTVRCQAEKDELHLGGTWATRGSDEVVLSLPQDEGEDEKMGCSLKACESDASWDCLTCDSEAVGFTAQAEPVAAARP